MIQGQFYCVRHRFCIGLSGVDSGSFYEVFDPEVSAMIRELSHAEVPNVGLLFSFDGAARGNPGPTASGVCGWWGKYCNDNKKKKIDPELRTRAHIKIGRS